MMMMMAAAVALLLPPPPPTPTSPLPSPVAQLGFWAWGETKNSGCPLTDIKNLTKSRLSIAFAFICFNNLKSSQFLLVRIATSWNFP
jgi:hypothetical protein